MIHIAQIALYNDKNQILLQYRGGFTLHSRHKWTLFGGHVEAGETPRDAIIREIDEELEYALQDPRFLFEFPIPGADRVKHIFAEKYDGVQPLVLHEGEGLEWYTIDEAKDVPTQPYNRDLFDMIRQQIFR